MKNKFRFILPGLIMLTAIVGLTALIIGMIFKLLVFVTILFGIGRLAAASMRRRSRPVQHNYRTEVAIMPIQGQPRVKKASIVPVY